MYHDFKSLNKRQLRIITKQKIKDTSLDHVIAVVNLLVDELNKKIMEDKLIEIKNFITFKLFRMPEKKAYNYYTGEVGISKPYNKLSVILDKKMCALLSKNMDISKYDFEKK